MAAARPLVNVYSTNGKVKEQVQLPAVMLAPIRQDIVQFVHTNMAKNKRQPYAVSSRAGHQTSAISWGTGRAVSRIPRVPGGGTSRSGQGAFGNMCRKGRMFAPTKVWRKWHRKINLNQKRYAVASCLAASAVTALVMARGHRVNKMLEVPFVLSDGAMNIKKTKDAYALLKTIGASLDVDKARRTKKIRAGKGKMRNRRYALRKGPLVVYDKPCHLLKAVRNLPGVETAQVDSLSVLQLAPGGHLGRLCIWLCSAFKKLDSLFGTKTKKSSLKTGYTLPNPVMSNADLARIINSDEVQSVLRPKKIVSQRFRRKKNPLKNHHVMMSLNPYSVTQRRRAILQCEENHKKRLGRIESARKRTERNIAKKEGKTEEKKEAVKKVYTEEQKKKFKEIRQAKKKAVKERRTLVKKRKAAGLKFFRMISQEGKVAL